MRFRDRLRNAWAAFKGRPAAVEPFRLDLDFRVDDAALDRATERIEALTSAAARLKAEMAGIDFDALTAAARPCPGYATSARRSDTSCCGCGRPEEAHGRSAAVATPMTGGAPSELLRCGRCGVVIPEPPGPDLDLLCCPGCSWLGMWSRVESAGPAGIRARPVTGVGQRPVPGGLIGAARVAVTGSSHKAFIPTGQTFAPAPEGDGKGA